MKRSAFASSHRSFIHLFVIINSISECLALQPGSSGWHLQHECTQLHPHHKKTLQIIKAVITPIIRGPVRTRVRSESCRNAFPLQDGAQTRTIRSHQAIGAAHLSFSVLVKCPQSEQEMFLFYLYK